MADDEKDKSTNEIIQALDALSQLSQARANRRTTSSLALPRSGKAKGGDDAGAVVVDAAVKEARPRLRRRSSLTSSPSWSKPKEERGDDADLIIIIKSQGSAADEARPQPRRRISLMLPFQSRSKLEKKEEDDEEEEEYDDDDWTHSAPLKSQGFAAATLEADAEKKGIMSWEPIRARSHIGMRRIACLFSMEVVAALGLPQSMNGLRLAVTVRNKETRDGAVQTKPARVQMGVAYFDEALYVRCHLNGTGEPRPFLLSLVAVDAPELDFGRSTVDLSLFAKEFTDKCVRQWDMVFPLAGKAKGGELVVKLAFQSIDSQATGDEKTSSKMLTPKIRRSEGQNVGDKTRRKLRRSSVSNTETPKIGVLAPELRGIDSFKFDDDEPEPELTPIDEVKETQQIEPEREPADEPTPVADVKEEEQQKEPESEPADKTTPVAEVKEEEKQIEPEHESAAEPTSVAEVKQDEEQQREPERESADEPTPVAEVKEEEKQKEAECEQADEPTPVAELKEEEQEKEIEREPADESTLVDEVKEEEQQKEAEREPADEPTPAVAEVKEDEQQKEQELDQADDHTPVTEVKEEEQQKEPEDAQDHDDSELSEHDVIDGQQVKAELLKEEAEAKKGSEKEASLVASDGVATVVANGLEEKSVEATMPSDVLHAVADAVDPVDAKAARLEEVTGDSLQVPEQGEDKGKAAKPPRRRFKWRTVALLVPISVLVSNTLGSQR